MTIPFTNLTKEELIREVDNSDNQLAKALLAYMEEATDLEVELADAIARSHSNVQESLQELSVVVRDEVWNLRDTSDLICEAIAIHCDDEGLPDGLQQSIEAIIKRERSLFEELIAEAWPKHLLAPNEQASLEKEVAASTAGIDTLPNDYDFVNPFPEVLEAKRKKAEEEQARYAAMRKEANVQKVINRKSKGRLST